MFYFERAIEQLIAIAPVKSIQTDYLDDPALGWGPFPSEDVWYFDVTIDEVDITKSICQFDGKMTGNPDGLTSCVGDFSKVGASTCRLIDETTLRISSPCATMDVSHMSGRWWVIEYV